MTDTHLSRIINWNRYHAWCCLVLGCTAGFVEKPWIFVAGACLSFAFFVAGHSTILAKWTPFGGYSNWITTARLLLVAGVGIGFSEMSDILIYALLIFSVLLDVIDGHVARQRGEASDFGLYYDMEVDAFYVATMCLILIAIGFSGAWILIVGALRYLFVVTTTFVSGQDKKQRFASTIAGFLFVALPTPFLLSATYARPIVIGASIAVLISFAYSFYTRLRS